MINSQAELQSIWIGPNQCIPGKEHDLIETTMREDGVDYPILKCKNCSWWG
jgi:hypothetical protein